MLVHQPMDGLGRVVLVRARSWICALPVVNVVETMRVLPIQPVRGAPPFVRGVAVIRGAPLPVVDLAAFLEAGDSAGHGAGKSEFLAPYEAAIQVIPKEEETLQKELSDSADQHRRMDELPPWIRDKLANLAETIALCRTAGLKATAKVIAEGRDQQLMDEIRRRVVDMITHEKALLEQRETEAARASRLLTTVFIADIGVTVLFSALAAFLILRGIDQQIGTIVQHMLSASAELQAAAPAGQGRQGAGRRLHRGSDDRA